MKKVSVVVFALFFCLNLTGMYAQEEVKVIDYKKLLPLIPPKIGDMVPKEEPDGKTTKMGNVSITEVSQLYADPNDEKKTASIRMSYNSMLARAGSFAMMIPDIEEESTSGYKKSITIKEFKAMVEYTNKDKQARVMVAVGPLMIEGDATGVENPDILVKTIEEIDLDAIKKLTEE